jgi:hypothetical protein
MLSTAFLYVLLGHIQTDTPQLPTGRSHNIHYLTAPEKRKEPLLSIQNAGVKLCAILLTVARTCPY